MSNISNLKTKNIWNKEDITIIINGDVSSIEAKTFCMSLLPYNLIYNHKAPVNLITVKYGKNTIEFLPEGSDIYKKLCKLQITQIRSSLYNMKRCQ